MERYSQFRDRGTGIAPFFPIPSTPSGVYLPLHALLLIIRLPFYLFFIILYFVLLSWIPNTPKGTPSTSGLSLSLPIRLAKKATLWCILGIPGLWWIDLRIDGVRRGSLSSRAGLSRLPGPGSIIAASCTSPLDALYLAAIFDPIFVTCWPRDRRVKRTSLAGCLVRFFGPPQLRPEDDEDEDLVTLADLARAHPKRCILLFPECTPSNGRAVLPLSHALLEALPRARIFPISLKYNPADVTTPVPGVTEAGRYFWNLLGLPTRTIRVRLASAITNEAARAGARSSALDEDADADADGEARERSRASVDEVDAQLIAAEKDVLDRVGEALARLGRVKRVALGVQEKIEFLRMWRRRRR